MESTDLRNLQLEELQMAKEIIVICHKYDLNYFILGGTLLGAVRHQGFIPWDDDLDIGLKREDYEKFLQVAPKELKEPYSLHHCYNDTEYIYPYARMQNSSIKLRRENTTNKTIQELWVDIFPLDAVPEKGWRRFLWEKYLYILRGSRNLSCFSELVNINKEYKGLKKVIVNLGRKTKVENLLNTNRILKKIDKFLASWSLEKYSEIGNPMGGHWFKEVFPKDYYSKSTLLQFEDIEMKAPIEFENVLEKMYGDYHQLPKLEDRNWHGTSIVKE